MKVKKILYTLQLIGAAIIITSMIGCAKKNELSDKDKNELDENASFSDKIKKQSSSLLDDIVDEDMIEGEVAKQSEKLTGSLGTKAQGFISDFDDETDSEEQDERSVAQSKTVKAQASKQKQGDASKQEVINAYQPVPAKLKAALKEIYKQLDESEIEYLKTNTFAHYLLREYVKILNKLAPYEIEKITIKEKIFEERVQQLIAGTVSGPMEIAQKYNKYVKPSYVEELADIRHRLAHALYKSGYYSFASMAAQSQAQFDYYLQALERAKDVKAIAIARKRCINSLQSLETEIINSAPVFVVWFNGKDLSLTKRQLYDVKQIASTINMMGKFEIVIYGITATNGVVKVATKSKTKGTSKRSKGAPTKYVTRQLTRAEKLARSTKIANLIKQKLIGLGVNSKRIYAAAGLADQGKMSSGLDGDRVEIHIR